MCQHVHPSSRPELWALPALASSTPCLIDIDLCRVLDQLLLPVLELNDLVDTLCLGCRFIQVC